MGTGFNSMTPEERREASRKGGQTAHKLGRAHKFTREEAREAGRKGMAKRLENVRKLKEAIERGYLGLPDYQLYGELPNDAVRIDLLLAGRSQ